VSPCQEKKQYPSAFYKRFFILLFLPLYVDSSRLSFLNNWLQLYRIAPPTHQDQGLLGVVNNYTTPTAPGNFVAPKNYQCHAMSN
jgi:hypothetical protein